MENLKAKFEVFGMASQGTGVLHRGLGRVWPWRSASLGLGKDSRVGCIWSGLE
ncbi:hypothetical protein Mapa_014725 [Marchantia paleacea]|nr:hypothetical protein Mapa_014725 [Marchantia paleacea]